MKLLLLTISNQFVLKFITILYAIVYYSLKIMINCNTFRSYNVFRIELKFICYASININLFRSSLTLYFNFYVLQIWRQVKIIPLLLYLRKKFVFPKIRFLQTIYCDKKFFFPLNNG